MTYKKHTTLIVSFLALLTGFFSLQGQNTTLANLLGDYIPEDNPKKIEQRRSVGSGSRSTCTSSLDVDSISLLVPNAEVVHQTASSRPNFYLFSNASYSSPLLFTLVDPESAKTIFKKDFQIGYGFKDITLPESISLKSGKVYLWYVAIPCENNPEQHYEVLSAAVEKVALPKKAEYLSTQSSDNREIATIYASNGIWYDALSYAMKEPSSYLEQLLLSAGITNFSLSDAKN